MKDRELGVQLWLKGETTRRRVRVCDVAALVLVFDALTVRHQAHHDDGEDGRHGVDDGNEGPHIDWSVFSWVISVGVVAVAACSVEQRRREARGIARGNFTTMGRNQETEAVMF